MLRYKLYLRSNQRLRQGVCSRQDTQAVYCYGRLYRNSAEIVVIRVGVAIVENSLPVVDLLRILVFSRVTIVKTRQRRQCSVDVLELARIVS